MFQVCLEDLEPDLAAEITQGIMMTRALNDEVQKLKSHHDNFKDHVTSGAKEEFGKFRVEVRQTLTEHYEYIKELHNELENQLKKNKSEQAAMVGEFTVVQQGFSQVNKLRDR
jgi:hypothetical protein